jgi:hypothetical protein
LSLGHLESIKILNAHHCFLSFFPFSIVERTHSVQKKDGKIQKKWGYFHQKWSLSIG